MVGEPHDGGEFHWGIRHDLPHVSERQEGIDAVALPETVNLRGLRRKGYNNNESEA